MTMRKYTGERGTDVERDGKLGLNTMTTRRRRKCSWWLPHGWLRMREIRLSILLDEAWAKK
jgi:hypothetical protein